MKYFVNDKKVSRAYYQGILDACALYKAGLLSSNINIKNRVFSDRCDAFNHVFDLFNKNYVKIKLDRRS